MVVVEDHENKTLWVESEKRKKRLRVYIPKFSNFSFWHITYEDGTKIPELEGTFITKRDALKAIEYWEEHTKESKEVYRDKSFGPANPPELKRKKVKRATVDKSEAG